MKIRLLVLLTLLLAACSGGGRWHTHDAYSRPTPAGGTGAAYFLLHNASDQDDALLGASSDVAATVEIHRSSTTPAGEPADHEHTHGEGEEHPHEGEHPMSEAEMEEMMDVGGMQKIERIELPAGHEVEFAPGGYHVMLIGLTRELVAGDTFELTLHFEHAADLTIQVHVLAP